MVLTRTIVMVVPRVPLVDRVTAACRLVQEKINTMDLVAREKAKAMISTVPLVQSTMRVHTNDPIQVIFH